MLGHGMKQLPLIAKMPLNATTYLNKSLRMLGQVILPNFIMVQNAETCDKRVILKGPK